MKKSKADQSPEAAALFRQFQRTKSATFTVDGTAYTIGMLSNRCANSQTGLICNLVIDYQNKVENDSGKNLQELIEKLKDLTEIK